MQEEDAMFLQIERSPSPPPHPSIDDINFTLYDATAFARYPGSIRPVLSSTNKYAPRARRARLSGINKRDMLIGSW